MLQIRKLLLTQVALQQNRTAALTTNIALESTDDSRFILPEVRRDTEATTEGKEEESSGTHESRSSLSEGESAEKVEEKDPTRLFEALEKPETLDLKEEEASLEKLTTRKTQARRKAARQKKEKLAQTTEFDFYRLEKPEEISKEERLELEQMMLPQPTARKPGQTQKVDSKQKAEAVRRKLSSVRQTRVEKSQRIQPKSDELQSDAKRRKKEPLKKQETSQRKTRAEFRRLDSSKKTQKSQYVDLPQKSLVLDVSQKTERRSRREVSKKSQRSLRRIWSRRISNPLRVESSLKLSKTRKEEASQRATKAQQKEQSSDPLSIKESPTVEAESDPDETSAKKSSSMPAINVCHRSRDPPTCHYKYVTVRMEMTGQDLDVNITENLVLIFVPFTSPAFYHLVIGDQIIECDGLVPKSLREFYEFLYSSNREVTLGVVRAWNVHPPTPKRMDNVWPIRRHCYLIVELPLVKNLRAGYEFQCGNGRLYFSKVEQQTMGAFAFLTVDRVLDVDSDKNLHRPTMITYPTFRPDRGRSQSATLPPLANAVL
ncbi:hypothetical protein Y032_0005g2758 [Ancylostoma ceylanicum]|uniref:Uncharacterized protein n=1 Tax=Ancylostoma ceylanicum TaxID=53326 RepID=A0A016VTA4_9BILA|nr:hypothetical protein Y032_0005g2758 [Ancylostoma ceylanicum]